VWRCASGNRQNVTRNLGSVSLGAANGESSCYAFKHGCGVVDISACSHDRVGPYARWLRSSLATRRPSEQLIHQCEPQYSALIFSMPPGSKAGRGASLSHCFLPLLIKQVKRITIEPQSSRCWYSIVVGAHFERVQLSCGRR
jgi:hypothetical protein